eukprot:6209119-Pleurochrysis_carterae.AAC.4
MRAFTGAKGGAEARAEACVDWHMFVCVFAQACACTCAHMRSCHQESTRNRTQGFNMAICIRRNQSSCWQGITARCFNAAVLLALLRGQPRSMALDLAGRGLELFAVT